jgi:predicted acylesterase/phospholipase RssA
MTAHSASQAFALASGLLTASGLALAGCTTIPRLDSPPLADAATPVGIAAPIRLGNRDSETFALQARETTKRVRKATDGSIDILALSGGGGGAFGAGLMVGLSKAGLRRRYGMVTGVSTGSMIAPFVFLGPEWDDELAEAYGGKATDGMLKSRGIGVLFQSSVFRGEPLAELIERFITDDLIEAVAKESATGRVLLVATTNLDREDTEYWNMGALAQLGGETAHKLFRTVLTASSSVPGVFPPVMITVEQDGVTYQEMHVDGGATTPFFVAPDLAMVTGFTPESLRGAHVQVVINGQISTAQRSTKNNAIDIAARSFSAAMNHMARVALLQTEAFAARNSMTFAFTAIPDNVVFGGSLALDEAEMKAMFEYGMRCGEHGEVWMTPAEALEQAERDKAARTAPQPTTQADCPMPAAPAHDKTAK